MRHIDYKKNIRRIAVLFLLLFAAVFATLFKFVLWDAEKAVVSPYNRRLGVLDTAVERGSIYDAGGNLLAQSIPDENGYIREYFYGEAFAHTLGYMSNGKYGVEAKYNFNLQRLTNELWQRFKNVIFDEPLKSDDLTLTLELELQTKAYELLKGKKGGIVAIEPSTGKILAQVSYPAFDPNTITDDWSVLISDTKSSPLLNRATQGLYPPGSVFKLVTYIAGLEGVENFLSMEYECEGEAFFDGSKLRCFNQTKHGLIDIKEAFALSCNTMFAQTGILAGNRPLITAAEKLYFNKPYPYPLDYSVSSFVMEDDADMSELVQTSIGQGKTLATPLHLAMLASAVANNGVLMKPYIADYSTGYNGKIKNKQLPEMLEAVMPPETAFLLTEMMIEVVNQGTAKALKIDGIEIAAKTGTAENPSGDDHGLLIAFAPAQNPKIALAIVLENSGGSVPCQAIAKELITLALYDEE